MADRSFYPLLGCGDPQPVILTLKFFPNGSSAIDQTTVTGSTGYLSVAYTSTGQYTITLNDSYVGILAANANVALATPADIKLQWGAIDVVSAKTLVLNSLAVAALTDIAANAGNYIMVTLILKNSSI